jgi:NAD(P)-dependent dehydrogenase (short-subunit alcohol dehydrogenase family)
MLISRGDKVTATVLNDDEASQLSSRYGAKLALHHTDFSDADGALESLSALVASMDRLDAVAICAGVAPYGPMEYTPLPVFRRAFEINCVANVAIFQAVLPALRESGGRIVIITSMAGRAAMPFIGAYVASKYALEGVGDVMRREAAEQGVLVSMVEPGGIRTGMVDEQLSSIKDRINNLTAKENELYGHLYRQFETLAGNSRNTTASTAEDVAAVLLEALDAPVPAARYIAGDDARELIQLAETLSDAELDGAFSQMYASADARLSS